VNITRDRMNRGQIANWLIVAGYAPLSLCGLAQWVHTLRAGQAEGLSPWFLSAFALGLALLQGAFRLSRAGLGYELGNGVGLCNALMMLGAWWWVQ
jgi:hypothetical protein